MKRILDILLSGFLMFSVLPVIVIAGLCIVLTMGRPILFVQERPGKNGKTFRLYKLRTMHSSGDKENNSVDSSRITSLGGMLRKYSIDELPQLWNVIKGDMSLVGPRPLLVEYLNLYSPEQKRRHEVRPGVTGWAQINGRNAISWEEKFALDVWYVDNCSILLDIYIILLTAKKVFKMNSINASAEMTMPKFEGTHYAVNTKKK